MTAAFRVRWLTKPDCIDRPSTRIHFISSTFSIVCKGRNVHGVNENNALEIKLHKGSLQGGGILRRKSAIFSTVFQTMYIVDFGFFPHWTHRPFIFYTRQRNEPT